MNVPQGLIRDFLNAVTRKKWPNITRKEHVYITN